MVYDRVFIFIDESGDPGNILEDGASSKYYAELALQINSDSFGDFIAHIISWKYVSGRLLETKPLPKGAQCRRYLAPLLELYYQGNLYCSCVYLLKDSYSGPYLKPELSTGHKPLKFRNFIHRQLLEHHFTQFPMTNRAEINLIFDEYKMSLADNRNLEDYLHTNWNLPSFECICHASSIYTCALQVASQLVNAIKDIALGKIDEERRELLSFIALKDITEI